MARATAVVAPWQEPIVATLNDRLGRLCSNCPFLTVEERVAMMREEHGHAIGSSGGPALQRAIQVGRAKLGLPG
jgi:hypothetical protein